METYSIENTFKTINLSTKVRLQPHQMTYDFESHLKKNLEKRVVGYCINDGMITEVKKIINMEQNLIVRDDYSGATEFDLTYICEVCIPLVGTVAVLKITNIIFDSNDFLIYCSNGYITCVLRSSKHVGTIKIEQGKLFIHNNSEPLKAGNYIKVLINSKRVIAGDTSIGVYGSLIDIASLDEVKQYYKSTPEIEEDDEIDHSNVVYNDDHDEDVDDYADI